MLRLLQFLQMCKKLQPSRLEIIKFNIKLLFSYEDGFDYASAILLNKIYIALGNNITKYVTDWNMIVLSISMEENDEELSYFEETINKYFFEFYDNSSEINALRQKLEDKLIELCRTEVMAEIDNYQYSITF